MGGAGMFAVSVYMMFMGGYYDKLVANKLPAGATLDTYRSAAAGTDLANTYNDARSAAGPEVLNANVYYSHYFDLCICRIGFIYARQKKTNIINSFESRELIEFYSAIHHLYCR